MDLKLVMEMIAEHQTAIGHPPSNNLWETRNYINDLCLALNVEIAELLQELPWKKWKAVSHQNFNPQKAGEEVIDILIFAFDIWFALGYQESGRTSAETLITLLSDKLHGNMNRLETNYHTTHKEKEKSNDHT